MYVCVYVYISMCMCICVVCVCVGTLKGFMLVEYQSSHSAEQAKKIADGYIMDKHHTFRTNLLPEVLEALQMGDEFKEETPLPYPGEGQGDIWWWAMKEDAHDQYALLHQGEL